MAIAGSFDSLPSHEALQLSEQARAHYAAGAFTAAAEIYRRCILLQPSVIEWRRNLGLTLLGLGENEEAATLLKECGKIAPEFGTLHGLGVAWVRLFRFEDARGIFLQLLDKRPGFVPLLLHLAEIAAAIGTIEEAAQYYRSILDSEPDNEQALTFCLEALLDAKSSEGVALLKHALEVAQNDSRKRTLFLKLWASYGERLGRVRHRLPPEDAVDGADNRYRFAMNELEAYRASAEAWSETNPEEPWAWINLGLANAGAGRWDEAEAYFSFARTPRTNSNSETSDPVSDVASFDPQLYDLLDTVSETDLARDLPPVEIVKAVEFRGRHVFFLSCDDVYFFDCAQTLLKSMAEVCPAAQVHLHVMDATKDVLAQIVEVVRGLPGLFVAISAETTPYAGRDKTWDAKIYYHAIRFVRFYERLRAYRRTLWMTDVDSIMRRDPTLELETVSSGDFAFTMNPTLLEPWSKINASLLSVNPTEMGLKYAKLVAARIAQLYRERRLLWGVDQLTLFGVYEYLQRMGATPKITILSPELLDINTRETSYFWFQHGRRKILDRQLANSTLNISGVPRGNLISELRKLQGR